MLIDEAQMLRSRQLMEEFRGLLNLELPGHKLVTFVFFGLPDIEDNLKLDKALAQRVALKYRLQAFRAEDTAAYIQHRLRLSGTTKVVFTPDAVQLIHYYAQGVPRLINTICDNALFEGYLLKSLQMDRGLILDIIENLGLVSLDRGEASPAGDAVSAVPPPIPLPVQQSPVAVQPAEDDPEIDGALAGLGDHASADPPASPPSGETDTDINNALEGLDEVS